jgi:hypothetical protein
MRRIPGRFSLKRRAFLLILRPNLKCLTFSVRSRNDEVQHCAIVRSLVEPARRSSFTTSCKSFINSCESLHHDGNEDETDRNPAPKDCPCGEAGAAKRENIQHQGRGLCLGRNESRACRDNGLERLTTSRADFSGPWRCRTGTISRRARQDFAIQCTDAGRIQVDLERSFSAQNCAFEDATKHKAISHEGRRSSREIGSERRRA